MDLILHFDESHFSRRLQLPSVHRSSTASSVTSHWQLSSPGWRRWALKAALR